ncbi:MAG: MqnA/MqnD/SBP family protein, partial [Planctomycetota bacterium]
MTAVPTKPTTARPARLGAVSYLNTLPMIEGLGKLAEVTLTLTPPSELASMLERDEVDLALASSIDYQRSSIPLAILPVGMIGSSGPTLTVRLFSRVPIEDLKTVACDVDSHTSVTLLRIVLQQQHGLSPELLPFDADALEHRHNAADDDWPESLLLIGDKVVTASPPAIVYPHQLDLGEAWKDLTGLPFV